MKTDPPASVDEYLAQVESEAARKALVALRRIILDEVPGIQEVISYRIPTYKFNKRMVSIAAFKSHCSFFPGSTSNQFVDELKGFKSFKGTVQFTPDRPLPEALVRQILRARFSL